MSDLLVKYFVIMSTKDGYLTSNRMIKQQDTEALCKMRSEECIIWAEQMLTFTDDSQKMMVICGFYKASIHHGLFYFSENTISD